MRPSWRRGMLRVMFRSIVGVYNPSTIPVAESSAQSIGSAVDTKKKRAARAIAQPF